MNNNNSTPFIPGLLYKLKKPTIGINPNIIGTNEHQPIQPKDIIMFLNITKDNKHIFLYKKHLLNVTILNALILVN